MFIWYHCWTGGQCQRKEKNGQNEWSFYEVFLLMLLFSLFEYLNISRLRQILPNSHNILSKKQIVDVVSFITNRVHCIYHLPMGQKSEKRGKLFQDPDLFLAWISQLNCLYAAIYWHWTLCQFWYLIIICRPWTI